jgi:uncharacterized membrane protein YkvA (DUF1232 family)
VSISEKLRTRANGLKEDTAALYLAFGRKETPILAKLIIGVAVCYALSPIDLIPDFIPVIGLLDDVILLPALVAVAVKLIPPEVMKDCRARAAGMWGEGNPKRFLYAVPVVLIWLAIIGLIVKAVFF